jgi:transcription elongation factor GreB
LSEPNYLTPQGAEKLQTELAHLVRSERPKVVSEVAEAAAQGDRSENAEYIYGKKRLREIDRRIRFLEKRLTAAVVVTGIPADSDQVRFGARVTVVDEEGVVRSYVIVGPDESNPDTGHLSFQSPVGRALMKKRVGDVVVVKRPIGDLELEITAIS